MSPLQSLWTDKGKHSPRIGSVSKLVHGKIPMYIPTPVTFQKDAYTR